MKMKHFFRCFCLLAAALFMTQCTLDDENSVDSSSTRKLSRITVNGTSLMKFTYDRTGRPSGIVTYDDGSLDSRYTISYDPMQIVLEEIEDSRTASKTTYTNISKNNSGFIVSMDATDCTYVDDGENVYESYSCNFYYNNFGQLIQSTTTDEPDVNFTWYNSDLVGYDDNEGFTFEIKYLITANQQNQWNPLLLDEPLFMLGLFGKAPAHHVKSYADSEDRTTTEFAYAFDKDGYIEKIKVKMQGEVFVLNYVYL